jgi:hypothetical protein
VASRVLITNKEAGTEGSQRSKRKLFDPPLRVESRLFMIFELADISANLDHELVTLEPECAASDFDAQN